jgi:glucose uptake protein GlcU
MILVESYPLAVMLCFITMLCWGSWANAQKLARGDWRFQLFYWDYAIGVLLLALLLALTMGILDGVIWSTGMTFNIIAAGPAGFAIAFGLGYGGIMVAALWGVFVWREFAGAPAGTNRLLALMFACYLLGLGLIAVSRSV